MAKIKTNWRIIVTSGILFVLLFFLCRWGSAPYTYTPSSNERICNLALLMEGILEQDKFNKQKKFDVNSRDHVPRALANICDKECELISWRYAMLAWRGPLVLHLDIVEPWNSLFNRYQRELCFRGMTYEQILKGTSRTNERNIVAAFNSAKSRYTAYVYCYEHHYSFYKSSDDETTNILAISGKGTLFDPDLAVEDLEALPGSLIVLVEVSSNVHWSEPFDIDIDFLKNNHTSTRFELGLKQDKQGFYVCFIDCRVFYLKKNTPLARLSKLGTVEGARNEDRYELLKEYILSEK